MRSILFLSIFIVTLLFVTSSDARLLKKRQNDGKTVGSNDAVAGSSSSPDEPGNLISKASTLAPRPDGRKPGDKNEGDGDDERDNGQAVGKVETPAGGTVTGGGGGGGARAGGLN